MAVFLKTENQKVKGDLKMAVIFGDKVTYVGAVYAEHEHFWLDGMLSVSAWAWDVERHETVSVETMYLGIDGTNLAGGSHTIDISRDVARDMIRTYKQKALRDFCRSVTEHKQTAHVGDVAIVTRGRKVKKGTELKAFWIGERPTYQAKQCSWIHDTETIAGCFDQDGNKVWIKAEYLVPKHTPKSPNAKERDRFVKAYIEKNVPGNVRAIAEGRSERR